MNLLFLGRLSCNVGECGGVGRLGEQKDWSVMSIACLQISKCLLGSSQVICVHNDMKRVNG